MSITWLAPAALIGLGLIALPIAIHLLVRQQARTLAFPSLRFLRETQLASLRRRNIQDAALLACRVAIVAVAAIAAAGPVLQTAARAAGYAGRVSRAIVAIGSSNANLAEGAWASATFERRDVADALSDAVRWLNRQPPSSREVLIAGALRRGVIDDSHLLAVPAEIGIRFEPAPIESRTDVSLPVLTRRNGALTRADRPVHLENDATRVSEANATPIASDLVTIVARPADTALANAALGAVLDAGVPWANFTRRVVVVWQGADESAVPAANGAAVVRMHVPEPPASAADALMTELSQVSPPTVLVEPVPITGEQLAAWTRPPGPPSSEASITDEGDRRWLWALALGLLGVEWWLRGRRNQAGVTRAGGSPEARVA